MADASATISMTNPTLPLFKGENYEFWSIKMRTMLKSHGLWDLTENGAPTTDLAPIDTAKRDAKALFFIQQAVHETMFSKIAAAENANEAWTTLKTAFQGSTRVKTIKLQGLRRDFETLQMKKEESVQIFLTRVQDVVNQIRTLGDTIEEKIVVAKVLRSLTSKYDHVVAAIEESKDLSIYTFDELMGSLLTHETRLSKVEDKSEEKAFYMKGESSRGRGRGRHNFGRGRGNAAENQSDKESRKNVQCYYCKNYGHYQADCYKKQREEGQDVECYYCHKFGHVQADCYKKKREENQANYTGEKDVQPALFMAYSIAEKIDASNISLDNGCSNHMSEHKQLFEELDETFNLKVKLGDDKLIQVEDKGKVVVHTKENDKEREHGEARVEIRALRLSDRAREKDVKELTDELEKLYEKLNLTESQLDTRNLEIKKMNEERKILDHELARAKVTANRVVVVIANELKDANDKIMPVRQWLEERRFMQGEMQQLRDKLAIAERTARSQAPIEEIVEEDVEVTTHEQPANINTHEPITELENDMSDDKPARKFKTIQELNETTQIFFVADPFSYGKATEKKEWMQPMKEEINAIEQNQTLKLVELPKDGSEENHLVRTRLVGAVT